MSIHAQAKKDMQHHMSILQRRLAECSDERDDLKVKLEAAEMRAEIAERSQRDMAREMERRAAQQDGVREPTEFERIPTHLLCRAFGVSVGKVREAQERLGFMFRQLAGRSVTHEQGQTRSK